MSANCLWCDTDRDSKIIDKGKDYVCGSCVPMLMSYPQEALQKTYQKCLRMNYIRKATALETFLEGVDYGRETGIDRQGETDRGDDVGKRTGGGTRSAVGDR